MEENSQLPFRRECSPRDRNVRVFALLLTLSAKWDKFSRAEGPSRGSAFDGGAC